MRQSREQSDRDGTRDPHAMLVRYFVRKSVAMTMFLMLHLMEIPEVD
jgi:hypothetical protein